MTMLPQQLLLLLLLHMGSSTSWRLCFQLALCLTHTQCNNRSGRQTQQQQQQQVPSCTPMPTTLH
jgi:hypothetical protein